MSQVSRWGKEGKNQQMAESLKVRNRLPSVSSASRTEGRPCVFTLLQAFCLWGGGIFNAIPRKELRSAPGRDHFACQGNIRVSSGEQDHPASFKGGSSLGPQGEGGISLLPSSNLLQPSADALSMATSRPPEGRMGQPSRRKEQTQAEQTNLRTDFHYKIIKYSPDLKAWNKLHGAAKFRSCKIREHGLVWACFMRLVQHLRPFPISCCSYLLKTTTTTPDSSKEFWKKQRLMLSSPVPDQSLLWLPNYSKLCSSSWKAAIITVAQSWHGQSTLVQAEWVPHWSKHYMGGCGAATHFCAALLSWWPVDWQNFRNSIRVTS